MEFIAIAAFIGLFIIGLFLVFLLNKSKDGDSLKLLNDTFNNRMQEMTRQFQEQTKQMSLANRSIGDRLDNAAKVVTSVTDRLGKLEEANKRIYDIGKDIASLQDILRAPKLRGGLGEFFLADLLAQYFPKDQFEMPYTFRSGEKVDAALKLSDGRIVPIDAKFPLENFKKTIDAKDEKERNAAKRAFSADVKKRIDEIHRYILPDEGTMDFALLYIPAENVYYEVIIKDEGENSLSSYAFQKRVIPVSPNNFFVYLQTIVMGLRGLQIHESAKIIQEALVRLKGDFSKFGDEFEILGSHLTNASNKYEDSKRRFEKIGQKLENIELAGDATDKPKSLK